MTQTSGPQRDEPSEPQTAVPMWVAPPEAGAIYPPGFGPAGLDEEPGEPLGADPRGWPGESVNAAAPPLRTFGRRPVVAGVVGGVLIALLGLGGVYAVSNLTGRDDDGGQFSTQGVSRLSPPDGEGHGDADADGGLGQGLAPGGVLPNAPSQESATDT
ncbi:MAG: hypothetical protein ACOH2F_07105 [Cellulomonas sp.]